MSNTILIFRGDNKTFELTVRDKSGNTVSLIGAKIILTGKESDESTTIAIQLKNPAASGSSAEIEDTDLLNGKCWIKFVPATTKDLTKDQYVYDIQITLNEKVYTVIKDYIKITRDVTT